MSIDKAILGLLSAKPLSGYDLKKVIQESPFMYWSANNNQIYKALVGLLNEGLVTCEVQHRDSSPSKKVYSITERGQGELKQWVLSAPEPPEYKKTFLIQLAWADQLQTDEWNALLARYEEEIRAQLVMLQEKRRRKLFAPDRTPREAHVWGMIHDNVQTFYQNELNWLQQLRQELDIPERKERGAMNYNVVEKSGGKYLELASSAAPLGSEQDALDLVSACYEQDTHLILLHEQALSEAFFQLKNGVAGSILQKFVNYRLKVAAVIATAAQMTGKAKELLAESNRGTDFKVFATVEEAENWLLRFM